MLFFIITPLYAKTIVVLGDSLSAAYGIEVKKGWVALLEKKLDTEDFDYTVTNLSTSGDTSRNSVNKLKRYYKDKHAEILIIQIGSNDALRGLTLFELKRNLATLIKLAKKNDTKILLLTNRLPPNYGRVYTNQFKKVFQKIATDNDIPIVSEFLMDVAGHANLMQKDGLHPREKAQAQILRNIWPKLKPLL